MIVTRLGLALVKGTRHLDHEELEFDAQGPIGDRTFCLVDRACGGVLKTVENPRLVGVEVRATGVGLVATTPDGRSLEAATRDSLDGAQAGDYWGRGARIHLQDSELSAFFSEYLSRDVVFARAGRRDVVYYDPVSLVTTGSLARLARASGNAGRDLGVRFRATMTLELDSDPAPGARLSVGDLEIEVTRPISRCAVIDLDPATGERTNTRLLQRIPAVRGEIPFGMCARVVRPGIVRRGDAVRVL